MKRLISIALLVAMLFSLTACGKSVDSTTRSGSVFSGSNEATPTDPARYSPYDSAQLVGMDFAQVEALFQEAGFDNIVLVPVDDIDANSSIPDGAVEAVRINGLSEYTSGTVFDKDAEIIITYHNIPKILLPISQADAVSKHYMDVGRLFFDAGFKNVETDEVYDLPAGADSQTIITVNGQEIGSLTELPFDGDIKVIEHFPISEYSTTINIDFESNWIFSKYNVVVTLAGTVLGTLPHGESGSYQVKLPAGSYDLVFSSEKESDVSGTVTLTVNSDTTATYHISCNRKAVDVEIKDFVPTVTSNNLLMPFSSWHYLRKDYQAVVEELKAQGFTHVTAKETTNTFWAPDMVNTVVGIDLQGKTEFKHDDLIDKAAAITVYYHVADFSFEQEAVNVTEKESFELPYSLTSGDTIDSITFEIDNPDVLQRNEDGSYTALIPGTATVTASSGGHTYSKCKVEVAEIVVPIEKLVFPHSEVEVSVGSTFKLNYTVSPENANYTEMRVEISNELVELGEGFEFYSNEAGDSEISFYQDDRLLGSCVVHATFVEIEELTLEETTEEIFIGDTIDLAFKLFPENATNKGITVSSSDTRIAEVVFDERGASLVKIIGKAVGKATVTITTPGGTSYKHTVTVKEVNPEEIVLTNANPDQRIEVGTPIVLEVKWEPENTSIKELTWTSSNNKVIKIDKEGNLEAVGVGTAEITAKHKSGITAKITITVEPTLVTKVELTTDRDDSKKFYSGDKFTISATVMPENATDKSLTFSSSDESVAKVSNKGVVTAVGVGTATITVASPDGPKQTVTVTVAPSPQKFRITWSAYMSSNDHVGSNWSNAFYVNSEQFYSGSTIVLDPDSSFTVYFYVEDADSNPDTGTYREEIKYSEDLCKNGYTISTSVSVRENGGRYSGHYAIWDLKITITPVK